MTAEPDHVPGAAAAVSTIQAALEAFAVGDVDAFVGNLTEDAVVEPPAFLMGKRRFEGREGVRAGFAELEQILGPDTHARLRPRQYCIDRAEPSRVLLRLGMTMIRPDASEFDAEASLIVTMRDDLISGYVSWPDFEEARAKMQDPVDITP